MDTKGFWFYHWGWSRTKIILLHISGLIDEIREGDEVEFDLEEGKKGLKCK